MHNNVQVILRQVRAYTKATMRSRYRGTIAGVLWVIFNPIILYTVQGIVFKKILKIDLPNYMVFLLGGLLPWTFILQTADMTTNTFLTQAELLKAIRINPVVLILSQIVDNFINFLIGFGVILSYFLMVQDFDLLGIALLPISLVNLLVFSFIFTNLLAISAVFLRDLKFVIGFVLQIMFFATPIFYPPEFVPESLRWAYDFNIFYSFIEVVRSCIYEFEMSKFIHFNIRCLMTNSVMGILLFVYWKKVRNAFYIRL